MPRWRRRRLRRQRMRDNAEALALLDGLVRHVDGGILIRRVVRVGSMDDVVLSRRWEVGYS